MMTAMEAADTAEAAVAAIVVALPAVVTEVDQLVTITVHPGVVTGRKVDIDRLPNTEVTQAVKVIRTKGTDTRLQTAVMVDEAQTAGLLTEVIRPVATEVNLREDTGVNQAVVTVATAVVMRAVVVMRPLLTIVIVRFPDTLQLKLRCRL
jgi:hypothetical protein